MENLHLEEPFSNAEALQTSHWNPLKASLGNQRWFFYDIIPRNPFIFKSVVAWKKIDRSAFKSKDWIIKKKERARLQGKTVKNDSKYTGRRRPGAF